MTRADNPWLDGNQFVLRVSEGAAAYTWQLWFGAGGDVRIDVDERSARGARSSELVVVAGAALLSRGAAPPDGDEIDAVDGPGLMLKLALELLGRALRFTSAPRFPLVISDDPKSQ